ncbi:hypothetical protein BDP27DRAFT_1320110 [Rhodocollybia butyracea]|uniref:Uncharacterized protein n=1 Tax=Rhodocollybia butyracea TaxID=206335 RepID=A0A9P5PZ21_9AGAR|nr:hypothetical protein BDP27DRAFT_1320110 [Rhodocollybia butyracea]
MGTLNIVANSTLPSTNVDVFGYFSKDDQNNRTIAFGASIESLQILPSVVFDKIAVSYTACISDEKSSDFTLSGTCQIGFLSQDSWTLTGELHVHSGDSTTADFSFGSPNTFMLSELIKLQVSNIKFLGDYDFGARETTDINSGTSRFGSHGPVTVALIFVSGVPGVLKIVARSLNLGSLVQSIFGKDFAQDLLDISLEKLFMYYAWSSEYTTKPVSDGTGTRDGKYVLGYHAECDSQIYGIQFLLSLGIFSGNENDSGIKATATKPAPVQVICVTLHGVKGAKSTGPSFGFSTVKNDGRGFFIQAGVALFETTIGDIVLSYDFNPPSPEVQGFHGKLRITDADIKFLPNVEVEFELVKVGGEYRLRFVKLPTVFQAFLDAAKLISTIYDLTKKDKCGAVELLFDKIVKSSIDADRGITSIAFNVTGKYTLSIGGIDIPVVFKPLTFTVNSIPTSLKSFGASLRDFIIDNIPTLIQGLLDNTDAFAKVLALVALKKLSLETIKALICRGEYKPEPAEGDEPGPNQKPDQGKTTDKGGTDGDGYFDDTTGPPAGSGSVGGGSSVAQELEDQGVVDYVPAYVLDAFGVTPSASITPLPKTVYPLDSPGTPPHAPDSDPYGQIIEEAISKDFERWDSSADYATAASDALACALEYRAAIMLLRQVLQSSSVAPKLGKSFFDDYTARRTVLVHNFSTLSTRFAQKWLYMLGVSVSSNVTRINRDGTRTLEVSWSRLRRHETMVTAVTLYVNGVSQITKKDLGTESTTITIPGPLCLDLNVQVRVTAFTALYGGKPQYKTDYAFYAQGRSAVGSFNESIAVGFRYSSELPPSPLSQESYQWVPLPYSTHYPVLTIGNYTYWGVSKLEYGEGDGSLGLIVFDEKRRKLIRHWWDFRLEDTQYLDSITYNPGDTNVVFHGQSGRSTSIAASRLLEVPFIISADATKQPAPPAGMMYANEAEQGGPGDITQYPVLLLGPWSIWSVTDRNGGDLPKGALLFFDVNNKLVKTNNSIIFPPMCRIRHYGIDDVGWETTKRGGYGFEFNDMEKH